MDEFPNPFSSPQGFADDSAEHAAKMPKTLMLAILLLVLLTAFAAISAVTTSGHVFWGIPAVFGVGIIVGLIRGSSAVWNFARRIISSLIYLCFVPLVFSVGAILFALMGGKWGDGAGTPIALLFVIGLVALIPAGLLGATFALLGTSASKSYCQVATGHLDDDSLDA